MCIYIYIYIGERFWEEQKRKKNPIAKKVEKVIPISTREEKPVLAGEEILVLAG